MRRVLLRNGQIVWVNDQGQVVGIAGGGFPGAEPGISSARERDIMSRMPDADVVGLTGYGVVPGGERAVGARRFQEEGEKFIQPPPVPTYRPLGGAQQNNRGNTRIVTVDFAAGQAASHVASVVETPKANGDDAEVLSVQLGLSLPDSLGPTGINYTADMEILALIEWGVGGTIFSAIVDWNQGTSFSVSASFLRVSAQISAIPAIPGGSVATITLNASIAYGNAHSLGISSPLRRTMSVLSNTGVAAFNPGQTSEIVTIPPWAVGFTLVDGGIATTQPDWGIQVIGGPSTFYRVVDRTNQAYQVEGQFPIPGRSRTIQLKNNLVIAASTPRLIFNLAL